MIAFSAAVFAELSLFAARPSYTYVNYEANGYTWHCRLKNGAEPLLQGTTPDLSGSVVIPSEIVLGSGETLPITGIDAGAFEELASLFEITIPSCVTYLGEPSFCCCDALRTVNLPKSLQGKFEAEAVFEECPNVQLVYYTQQPSTPPDSDTHVVIFNANGGLVDEASREIAIGTAIGELPVPMQDGFDFAGWWTQLDGGELVTSDTVVDGEWETLYAHWEELVVPMYMIWLDAQGGTVAEDLLFVQDGKPIGELPEPTRDGYIFGGWWTDIVGGMQVTNSTIIDNGYISAQGDFLYAHWEELPFLITFNPGEGSVDEQVRQVPRGLSIGGLPVPARTGYNFVGWFTAAEDGEEVDATTVPVGDVTYYAHWAKIIVYHYVYLYADCGSGGAFVRYDRIRVVEGNTIGDTIGLGRWQSLIPAKVGYNFAGWWTDPTGGVEISAETAVSGELNVYSHWVAKVYRTIRFNPNGGAVCEDAKEIEEGTSLGVLPVPTLDGYDFVGWFTAAEDGEQVDATTVPDGDATYYAHWAKTLVYHCVYLYADLGSDGAFVPYNLIIVVEGNAIGEAIGLDRWQSLIPAKDGYNFAGWWTDPTGGVEITAETVVNGEVNAYAHWNAKVYCTITYDANGGSGGGTARGLEKGTSLGVLPVPSRYGYSFKGWWTSRDGGSQIGADTIVAEDMTYYARWDYAWTRTVENGEATLYGGVCRSVVPNTLSGSLAIPEEIDGDIVVGIGEYAFYQCSLLAEIVIPPSIRRIDEFAFQGCSSLTNIVIPASVEFVAPSAFSGCNGLASIEVEDGNQWYASVDGVLYDKSLTTLVRCPPAKSGLELPASVTGMEPGAIGQCRNIADDDGFVILFDALYSYTGGRETVFVPEGVKKIAEGAFGSSMIRTIIIPESVEEIEGSALAGCHRLSKLLLPNHLDDALDVSAIFASSVPEGLSLEYYSGKIIQVLFDGNGATLGETSRLLNEGAAIGALPTPEFGDAVFEGWWTQPIGGDEVTEGTVVSNGSVLYAHWQQTWSYITTARGIEVTGVSPVTATLAIPSEIDAKPVVSIGYAAFKNCSTIRQLILPENIETIRTAAFSNCGNIGNVEIPMTLRNVEGDAFAGAYVNELHILDLAAWCNIKFGDGYANPMHSCTKVIMAGEEVENLNIPDGVESVGEYAFYNFDALKSVEIPEGVTSIGAYAFYNCKFLSRVEMPDSVQSVGRFAFENCATSLYDSATIKGVILVDGWAIDWNSDLPANLNLIGVRGIADSTFYGCKRITELIILPEMSKIGNLAFCGCTGLSKDNFIIVNGRLQEYTGLDSIVLIPGSVKHIGDYIFMDNVRLESVQIPDGVESIGRHAFSGCTALQKVQLPDSLLSIDDYAFYRCSLIDEVIVPDSVSKIGDHAFYRCSSLEKVYLGDGVDCLGESAFGECSAITTIKVPQYICSKTIRSVFTWSYENLSSVEISDKVTSIGDRAFDGLKSLKKLEIPDRVKTIGPYAFRNCTALEALNIPDNVTYISTNAFCSCSNVVSLIIGNHVKTIDDRAFWGCRAVSSLIIPDSVMSMGAYAFGCCDNLKEVVIGNGVKFIGEGAFAECKKIIEMSIPRQVERIGAGILSGCTGIKRMSLPFLGENRAAATDEILTAYAQNRLWYTFDGLAGFVPSSLESVALTDTKILPKFAFWNCSNLVEVVLSEGTREISWSSFHNCNNLRRVKLPSSLWLVDGCAFSECFSLSEVEIPYGVSKIGAGAFIDCASLKRIVIPNTVTQIDRNAFADCIGIHNIVLPPSVLSIDGYAFNGCTNLRNISLPSHLEPYQAYGCDARVSYYSSGNGISSIIRVSNIRAFQRADTNFVDVFYDLSSSEGGRCSVSIGIEPGTVLVSKISGDTGAVPPGRNKHIIWDAGADWPNSCGTLVAIVSAGRSSAQSEPFAVDTRTSGDEFRIEDVRSSYCNGEYGGIGGRKATFLSGVECRIDFTVRGGTQSRPVDHVLVNGKRFDGTDFFYNVGELPPGGRLEVVAVDTSGRTTSPFHVNLDMADYPPMWSHATNLSALKYPDRGRIVYASSEINWFFLFDAIEELVEIAGGDEAMPIMLVPTVRTVQTMESDTAQYHIATETGGKVKAGQVLKVEVDLFVRGSQNHEWVASASDWMRIPSSFAVGLSGSGYVGMSFFKKLAYGRVGLTLSGQVPIEYVDGYWQYGFEGDPLVSLWGALGAGCSGIAAAEGRFDASIFVKHYSPAPSGESKNEAGYRAKLQFKYTVGPFEKTIVPMVTEGWFYGRPSRGGLRRLLSALPDSGDMGEYRLIPRDYVQKPTGRFAKLLKASSVADSLGDGYPNPAPSLAACGAQDHLVYLQDNVARSDINRTELVYRSGVSNEWCTAEAVWDDGTADFMPNVSAASNGTVFATWANLHEVLPDDAQFETMCANLEIAVGVRDVATGDWNCTNLTDDAALDKAPVVKVAEDGSAAVAWIRNEAGDFFGSDEHPSSVMVSYYRNGVWSAPEKMADAAFVRSIALEYDGSAATVAVDDGAGESARAHDMAAIPRIDGGSTVVWWQTDEDKVDGRLFCADYDAANDSIGEPLELERFNGVQLRNITGAIGGDGAMRLAYEEVAVSTNGEGSVEYGAVKLKTLRREVAASVVFPSDAFAFADDADVSIGALADIKVNVANAGVVASDELELWLWFGEGEDKSLLGVVVTNVPPLSAITLSSPWYVEEGLTNVSFTAEIRNAKGGQVEKSLVWHPDLGTPRISLRDVQCVNASDTLRLVRATIHNDGVAPLEAGAEVRFWRGEIGGELLGSDATGMVTSGDGGEWSAGMELDVSQLGGCADFERIVIEVVAGDVRQVASVMLAKTIAGNDVATVVTEDTTFDDGEFADMIEVRAGVRIFVRPKNGQSFNEADALALADKVNVAHGREGQPGRYFSVVGKVVDGVALIESKIDKNEVGLSNAVEEVLKSTIAAPANLADGQWTLSKDSVVEGFYYGIAAARTLEALNALKPSLSKADDNGATVVVTKPQDSSVAPTESAAFFKVVVSDVP